MRPHRKVRSGRPTSLPKGVLLWFRYATLIVIAGTPMSLMPPLVYVLEHCETARKHPRIRVVFASCLRSPEGDYSPAGGSDDSQCGRSFYWKLKPIADLPALTTVIPISLQFPPGFLNCSGVNLANSYGVYPSMILM